MDVSGEFVLNGFFVNVKYMVLNYLIDNMLPIAIAIGSAIAWLSERRKRKAEINGVEMTTEQGNAEVFQKMRSSYVEFISDINARLDELQKENAVLKKEVAELRKRLVGSDAERIELVNKVHDLEAQNTELRAELEKYKKELILYRKETKK